MLQTGGEGSWMDLGDMSSACMIVPHTCENGGTLMVWVKILQNQFGGILSTVSATIISSNNIEFKTGLYIMANANR